MDPEAFCHKAIPAVRLHGHVRAVGSPRGAESMPG
jgi:hypothetical protein